MMNLRRNCRSQVVEVCKGRCNGDWSNILFEQNSIIFGHDVIAGGIGDEE